MELFCRSRCGILWAETLWMRTTCTPQNNAPDTSLPPIDPQARSATPAVDHHHSDTSLRNLHKVLHKYLKVISVHIIRFIGSIRKQVLEFYLIGRNLEFSIHTITYNGLGYLKYTCINTIFINNKLEKI